MSDTIFSKIVRREIPADIVYEDDEVLGFRDLNPQAPVHVLFIPKQSLATLNDATPEQATLLGNLLLAAANYAKQEGFAEQGYRTVINCNEDGGQTVFHIHVHLLAGRRLHWPPG
ncbi:histidine triad nucleotide-binding protein [Rhodanobacter lindaniclasticus]|uniref:Histidine triad nucleotide-binding protein n=1 Tax=Rhodanobacter lindaniclasticus TaxID=75310 RepID=A0A4S3KL58_9GAMM|nr:histidine triad nucleotide-binding protein [Rhodanobacter lindaniclasticus]THD09595.1 histidine triad nucleotide-binding protein [Rhodanobacter lindaniclasticus]